MISFQIFDFLTYYLFRFLFNIKIKSGRYFQTALFYSLNSESLFKLPFYMKDKMWRFYIGFRRIYIQLLRNRLIIRFFVNILFVQHLLEHFISTSKGKLWIVIRRIERRRLRKTCKKGRFMKFQIFCMFIEIRPCGNFDTIALASVRYFVEIQLENLIF